MANTDRQRNTGSKEIPISSSVDPNEVAIVGKAIANSAQKERSSSEAIKALM